MIDQLPRRRRLVRLFTYLAIAVSFGTAYHAQASTSPTIVSDVGSVSQTGASINFTVTDTGSSPDITTYGVKYATHATYSGNGGIYTATDSLPNPFGSGNVGGGYWNVSSLSCGTSYDAAFFATNADGATGYSSDLTFTTTSCPPAFDGGDGTSGTPYQISTCSQLQDMTNNKAAYYELTGDVNCSMTNPADAGYDSGGRWSDGTGFVPIGASTTPFTGELDGKSYAITGLFEGTSGAAGLFGYLSGYVHDLAFTTVSISGLNNTGALAAVTGTSSLALSVTVNGTIHGNDNTGGLIGTSYGTIESSFASTTLSGNGEVGSLVGLSYGTTTASHADGTVTGVNYVGGFIGLENGTTSTSYSLAAVTADHSGTYAGAFIGGLTGSISESYARGAIEGGTGIGGFAGRLESTAVIENSYSRSDVHGYSSKLGGFVGSNNGSITNSYATGDVYGMGSTGTPFSVGGFAGDNDHIADDSFSAGTVSTTPSYIQIGGFSGYQDGTANHSAWWSGAYTAAVGSGPNSSIGYAVPHRDDMKDITQTFYTNGWDFVTFPVWDTATGTYPLLNAGWPYLHILAGTYAAEANDTTIADVDGSGGGGGGTASSFSGGDGTSGSPYVISDCTQFPLMNDYLSDSFVLEHDLDCTTLGLDVMVGQFPSSPFTGSFDGGGNTVTIELTDPSQPGLALFRAVGGGYIGDLTVNGSVFGQDMDASVVAVAIGAGLENVHASSTVVSLLSSPPGYPFTGTGGIVAAMFSGLIDNATFNGLVASPFIVGGIAGFVLNDLGSGDGAIISRSSSQAQVYGGIASGGLAGYVDGGSQIRNSYSSSTVEYFPDFGTTYNVGAFGGLIGFMNEGIVSRTYATGIVTAGSSADIYPSGGLIGVIQSASSTVTHSFSTAQVVSNGASVGGLLGVLADGDGTGQFYDNYFDTARSGLSSCTMESADTYEQCTGVDGSATNYWLGSHSTPLWAWDTTDTWNISGIENEFPTLRHSISEPPSESDAFTGKPVEDTTPVVVTPPIQHSAISRTSVLSHISSLLSRGKNESLSTYIKSHASLLKRYYDQGTSLAPAVLTALGITPPPAVASSTHSPVRDLQSGSTGDDVRALQNLLISRATGGAAAALKAVGATGFFGSLTRAAITEYQKANGISPAVGYFGPLTRASMTARGIAGLWW